MTFENLFTKNYNNYHVADQTIIIKKMITYFLDEELHNQYLITNVISRLIYNTYELVKSIDENDISTKLGYKYTIIVLKQMYNLFTKYNFTDITTFIESYDNTLELELRQQENL